MTELTRYVLDVESVSLWTIGDVERLYEYLINEGKIQPTNPATIKVVTSEISEVTDSWPSWPKTE